MWERGLRQGRLASERKGRKKREKGGGREGEREWVDMGQSGRQKINGTNTKRTVIKKG